MVIVGRNEPCPCGSGRRYKDCHGAIEIGEAAHAAIERFIAGDFDGAEALAQHALTVAPGHPAALLVLGRCEHERGRTEMALRMLLAAARGLSSSSLQPMVRRMVWSELNLMFTQALSGADSKYAAAKRTEYEKWVASLVARERAPAPLVSLVVILTGQGRWLDPCLASVFCQSHEYLELVVVDDAKSEDATHRLTHALQTGRLAHRLLTLPGASVSAFINAGVRAATGEFINLLHIDHELAPGRIAVPVERNARRGAPWGLNRVPL